MASLSQLCSKNLSKKPENVQIDVNIKDGNKGLLCELNLK
jgi:hypothetical protein